jgi:hypothetical protein
MLHLHQCQSINNANSISLTKPTMCSSIVLILHSTAIWEEDYHGDC